VDAQSLNSRAAGGMIVARKWNFDVFMALGVGCFLVSKLINRNQETKLCRFLASALSFQIRYSVHHWRNPDPGFRIMKLGRNSEPFGPLAGFIFRQWSRQIHPMRS
jgi:hypothetical protein